MPNMAPPEGRSVNSITDQGLNSGIIWGVKRGVGVKGKDIQFYDSFTYDGVEYTRYDCVYLHKEGEPEPYVGKICKIWEDRKEKKNKMKVRWFFRPIEIRNWLEVDSSPANKELFLASGEGKGVYNINLLEVIIGKCKVLCTSTDSRNPQPSEEDINNADFYFYKTFDVGKYTVSQYFSAIDAEEIFNKQSWVSKSTPSLDQPVSKDKTMTNGSCSLEKEEPGSGITKDELTKEKVGNEEKLTHLMDKENGVQETPVEKDKASKEEFEKNEAVEEETRRIERSKEEQKKTEITKEELTKVESELPSEKSTKEDSLKQSPRWEARSGEKKIDKNEPSKEEKKPLKRTRLMVDSDDEDGKIGSQVEGSENSTRKKIDSKKDVFDSENKVSKKARLSDISAKNSEGMTKAREQPMELNKEKKSGREIIEITKRPEVETNKWFKGLPWDERLRKGYEQRAVIRIQNFDASYTSSEIEDVMWHVFGERCVAKVLPQTMFSNPRSGDALVIFKTREAAEMSLKKLNQACLMFSDGRPLIATKAAPVMSGKQKFAGHISIEKHKLLMHRAHQTEDMRKAVSTSHCSQPNTIEYEMAMEWRLLQEKSEQWWNELYKQEASELNKVKHKNLSLTAKK